MAWDGRHGSAATLPSLPNAGRLSIPSSAISIPTKLSKRVRFHASAQKEALAPAACGDGNTRRPAIAGKKACRPIILALLAATACPNSPFQHPAGIACAQPTGQITQSIALLGRLTGQKASVKILDKVVTVITGQTMVTPDMVDELKSIVEDEGGAHDWKTDLLNNVWSFSSIVSELILNFNPQTVTESAGAGIQGLLEVAAERFAAFELSTLLALGERYLIWAPIVIVPMYWKMLRKKDIEEKYREGSQDIPQLTVQAAAKAERVRIELERMELKAYLLDAVSLLSKSSKQKEEPTRKHIEELMLRLLQLNPIDMLHSRKDTNILSKDNQSDSLPAAAAVHGNWNLIYVSQADQKTEQQYFLDFPNLNVPGFEPSNVEQHIWAKEVKPEDGFHQILARNTMEIRLGLLGAWKLAVQGSWQNLGDGRSALLSFDTFTLQAIEILGTKVPEDLPPLNMPIPRALQTTGEWEVVYLDEYLRINRGRMGQLFLFQRI